ncbi:MAG: hypothetical protein CML23_26045, partial [Rhizobiaceae bacterium]|nr:hypothetical protein [Rhizobiaceae bacterium]
MFEPSFYRAYLSALGSLFKSRSEAVQFAATRYCAPRQPILRATDKGYASKANRNAARSRGAIPVIPHKTNEKDKPARFAKAIYRGRARIEQAVGKLKRFKRVALRCEKTKR